MKNKNKVYKQLLIINMGLFVFMAYLSFLTWSQLLCTVQQYSTLPACTQDSANYYQGEGENLSGKNT